MDVEYRNNAATNRALQRFMLANISSPEEIIDLDADQGWALKGRRRQQTIYCLKGSIWVTQEGDIRDYILGEGDAFLVTLPGLVLVRALKPARIGFRDRLQAEPFRGRFRETVFH
jgi:hypothetical protein